MSNVEIDVSMRQIPKFLLCCSLFGLFLANCGRQAEFSSGSSSNLKRPKSFKKAYDTTAWIESQRSHAFGVPQGAELTLSRTSPTFKENFVQSERPLIKEAFSAPVADTEESFEQIPLDKLDILVVVDSSASMQEEQVNLAQRMGPLLNAVQESDWQIGVVTMDPVDGCLRGLIKKGEADVQNRFATAIQAGVDGSYVERGILQAVRSLKGCSSSPKWIRDDAALAVLFLTDEENCSDRGLKCDEAIPSGTDIAREDFLASNKAAYLTDYLSSIRTLGSKARVYGIFWHPSQSQAQCSTGLTMGRTYAEAIQATHGSWGSICSTDYTETLRSISQDMRQMLKNSFTLKQAPLADSLQVLVNDVAVTGGFQLSGKMLTFNDAPTAAARVKIKYSYATGDFQNYGLAQDAAGGTLKVTLDGARVLGNGEFAYDAGSKRLHLNDGITFRKIDVEYRKNLALMNEFQLRGRPVQGQLPTVKVNEVALSPENGGYSFDATGNKLIFSQIPQDSTRIEVSYAASLGTVTEYQFSASENERGHVTVTDEATGALLAAQADGQYLRFQEADVVEGRKVIIIVTKELKEYYTINLEEEAGPSTEIVLIGSDGAKRCTDETFLVSGRQLDASPCAFDFGEKVTVNLRKIASFVDTFALDNEELQKAPYLTLKVLVNGVETQDYNLDPSKKSIKVNGLKKNDRVEIEALYL
jgi:hypothetical protein